MHPERSQGSLLFLTSCPIAWGGSEELWAGAATILAGRGFRIHAGRSEPMGWGRLHPRWLALRNGGIGIGRFNVSQWDRAVVDAFNRFCPEWMSRAVWLARDYRLALLARLCRPQLAVISQGETDDGMEYVWLPKICQLAGIPYVIICQKSAETEWPDDRLRDFKRKFFQNAERVFFVSEHNRLVTSQQMAMDFPHGDVVRNPYMAGTEGPLPWPDVTGDDTLRLACVGRMWPKEKGQDLLLNVLARERWRHRPVEVNFYGEGPMGRGLEEMKNYLKLERVHFRGFVQDISEVWRTHHALVLASRAEGLPLAQVEAMMCGRPAIMTIAGGSAEILVEGETGFIAEAQTVEALDAAMERAWQRRGDWKSIGLRAAESVRKLIPEKPCEVFAEKLAQIHDAVVQRRNLNKI